MDPLEIFRLILTWLVDRKSRLRLAGYRPDVICYIECLSTHRVLLIQPKADPTIWIPPQEGLEVDEGVQESAVRCLEEELGIASNQIQLRKTEWIDKRKFPEERWGERDLPYSLRKIVGKPSMIGKGYYGAHIYMDSQTEITPNPAEIHAFEWVDKNKVTEKIASAAKDKQLIILDGWEKLKLGNLA